MIRRISATLAMVVIGLLSIPALAMAYPAPPAYPAPAADPGDAVVAPVADSVVASDPASSLAVTGAGFSVGTAIAIGAAVLLVGMFLVLVGNRMRKASGR